MKALLIALVVLALGGCVVSPAYSPYPYDPYPGYYYRSGPYYYGHPGPYYYHRPYWHQFP
jgi:hypothetical protein